MTNNDELALKVKSAAEKALPAIEKYEAGEIDGDDALEMLSDFTDVIKPANILAMLAERDAHKKQISSWSCLAKKNVEEHEKAVIALDAARQRIADLESKLTQNESWSLAAQKYIAELEKWIKDVETTMIAATDRAEAAEKLVAELKQDVDAANARVDTKCAQLCNQDEEIEMLRLRIAELEARTVSVKLPQGIVLTKTLELPVKAKEFCEYIDAMKWQYFEAIAKDCAAAGIKLEVGE